MGSFESQGDLSDDFEAISPQRSVLVVSFDDLSGRLSREEIESNAELREAFSDFTFFSNTIGNAPGTVLSLMHELYGARDFASMGDDLDEGRLKDRLESDTLVLNDPAVDAMAYGSYSIFADSPARKLTIGDLSGGLDPTLALSAINDLYDYIWLRLGTRFAVSLHQKLYQTGVSPLSIISERLRAGCSECSDFSGKLARHQGAQWDRINVNSVKDFDRFTEQVSPSDSKFSIRYMHFLFTHFPVDFDEDCTYRGDDAAWVTANQNEGGAREETRCALKGMVRLLNRLKAQGLYDNTAIIFKSDHGKTNDYAGGEDGKAIFASNPTWGRDRYMPLLMIKSAGAAPGDLEFDDRTAALSDLAATLCPTLPGRRDCSIYPGANLARPAQEDAPDIPVFIPRSETSSHRYQDLEVERLERGADLQALSGE